jgi:23S rRNA G2445 N2-methylase RlmL
MTTNKFTAILEEGIANFAAEEIEELLNLKSQTSLEQITFEATNQELYKYLSHSQCAKQVLLNLWSGEDLSKVEFKLTKDLFQDKELSFLVEVIGIRGQDNRIELAKKISTPILSQAKSLEINLKLDYKKPQIKFILFFDQEKYHLGIDLVGFEMNKRDYRLFPHQASFRGDVGFSIIKTIDYKAKEKLLICFMKDSVLPIEAAIYATRAPLFKIKKMKISSIPKFSDLEEFTPKRNEIKPQIFAFDEGMQSFIASRKNAKLAKVEQDILTRKHKLDELDTKYKQNEMDKVVVFLTKKDEHKMNDIYHQVNFILKPSGKLLFVTRDNFEPTVHSKYHPVDTSMVTRGESTLLLTLLEKKAE